MAEMGKGVTAGKLAINVQKKFTRAQEKVMQKLGKADETRDTVFEEMVANFNKQMGEGTKLQRDLKAYLTAVKTMHEASRRLQDCLADMYEPDWFGKEEVDAMAEDTDILWTDYHQKITDNSLISMDTYLAQFPDIKARIAKRDRKMVDFDSARHHFGALQKGKKKDEAKIAKAEEELGRAQKVFEELNVELQDELPALWDSRVGLYVNTFQNLAGYQETFHRDMGKLTQNLNDVMTKLDEQRLANEGANHSVPADSASKPVPSLPGPGVTPTPDQDDVSPYEGDASPSDANTAAAAAPPQAPSWDSWEQEQTPAAQEPRDYDDRYPQSYARPGWDDAGSQEGWTDDGAPAARPDWEDDGARAGQGGGGDDGDAESAVTNDSDGELPPGFVYKVKAVHDYAATDSDELELKSGDVVLVLDISNPDDQDDGWLMGVRESHWLEKKDISAKGVFPENFTQKV